nr:unnamed protein product [Callosobruchus analis]
MISVIRMHYQMLIKH